MQIDQRRCIWIAVFCALTFTAATIVMILYHTSLRFESNNDGTDHDPDDYQTINQNGSVCDNTIVNLLGDGYCDDEANTEQCLYDLGDCCDYTDYVTSRSLCTECFCYADIKGKIPSLFSNSSALQAQCEDIIVYEEWNGYGDGHCDQKLNNVDAFFDAGDCCYHPINPNQCIESNVFCDPNTMGDGICHDYNNGPFCDYDLGDCCLLNVNFSECCLCLCVHFKNERYTK